MASRVDFICTEAEERALLVHLTKSVEVEVHRVIAGSVQPAATFDSIQPSPWTEPLCLYFTRADIGPLVWHTRSPEVVGATHGALVNNLLAKEAWSKSGLGEGDRMLDIERSPILSYRRGIRIDGRMGPNVLAAAPSSPRSISVAYDQWVRRSIDWVRRRGAVIHDYRKRSRTLPNPLGTLNTVYASAGVSDELASNSNRFTLQLQGG